MSTVLSDTPPAPEATRGLSASAVDALRYNSTSIDPYESTAQMLSFIGPDSKVLDIGCGTGSITEIIRRERGADVVGIEPHAERADAARRLGFEVIHGTFSPDRLASLGLFDHVVFADVLEHLEDPYAMLRDAARVLKKGGSIVASIPNVAHWTIRKSLLAGEFEYAPTGIMDATHLRWFTRRSLRRLFEEAGYDILDVRHSAGAWMECYKQFPFSVMSERRKGPLLHRLGDWSHGLFACQHVIAATPRPS